MSVRARSQECGPTRRPGSDASRPPRDERRSTAGPRLRGRGHSPVKRLSGMPGRTPLDRLMGNTEEHRPVPVGARPPGTLRDPRIGRSRARSTSDHSGVTTTGPATIRAFVASGASRKPGARSWTDEPSMSTTSLTLSQPSIRLRTGVVRTRLKVDRTTAMTVRREHGTPHSSSVCNVIVPWRRTRQTGAY
jgi:hypothetical protein